MPSTINAIEPTDPEVVYVPTYNPTVVYGAWPYPAYPPYYWYPPDYVAGGALDYVVRGRAIGGFGVVALPGEYGVSGIMTFTVNQGGKICQADLGRETAASASGIRRFDPGTGWSLVESK